MAPALWIAAVLMVVAAFRPVAGYVAPARWIAVVTGGPAMVIIARTHRVHHPMGG